MKILASILFLLLAAPLFADEQEIFEKSIQPILKEYCITCHSTEKQKGDLDLERFSSLDLVKEDPKVWRYSLDQIHDGEMPPRKKPQPSPENMKLLTDWIQSTLDDIALSNAGDPGPVVMRRLSNHEYTYTLRDLTGVNSLDPAREFPIDGAAGEGFTNVGAALVMSPALLTKYLDAAKEVASHLVLLPDGVRFSASDSSQDWTHETLERIRAIYAKHTVTGKGDQTKQDGIALELGNDGGRLPLVSYLDAAQGRGDGEGLSPKYIEILTEALKGGSPSPLLDPLRAKFREKTLTAAEIEPWQNTLWRFAKVGYIGKENGPKSWQEPVTPLVASHEMRVKLEDKRDTTLYLTTTDAGDGTQGDDVIWEGARLVAPGRPDLPIHALPDLLAHLEKERSRIIESSERILTAIAADRDDPDKELLLAWRELLGYDTTKLEPLLTDKILGDYNFIRGWQGENALRVLANSSDTTVKSQGEMKAYSVATHPSSTHASVIAWRSPVSGSLHLSGDVSDAHPECGNGVTWALEVRRGHVTEILASGETEGATVISFGPFENLRIEAGQVVALIVGPREGDHSCDLTAVNLSLSDGKSTWDLAKDVSPNIFNGNPHGAWHFLSQPAALAAAPDLPAPLAAWRRAPSPELAAAVRQFLEQDFPLSSPLLEPAMRSFRSQEPDKPLMAKAPSAIAINIPAALAQGAEFVATGRLASEGEGSVQMRVLAEKPELRSGLIAVTPETGLKDDQSSDNTLAIRYQMPVIAHEGSEASKRFEKAFDEFRALFPIALCYTKIVPVDEIVTFSLYHREDEPLQRLMLTNSEARELDRLWDELLFVSEAPLKQVDVLEQIFQFASQEQPKLVKEFEQMREPTKQRADAFKQLQIQVEPQHVQAVLDFANQAWRRPLSDAEQNELRAFYANLRKQDLQHTAATRLMLARVLTSPTFLYRSEKAAPGPKVAPVSNVELATRLSYFLTSSAPDEELHALAAEGRLSDDKVLASQARRLLKSVQVRRLATEFGCQYLHVRDIATLDEKSERHFPDFIDLRDDMQEEVTRFFIDLFQNDRSVLSLLDADHTFVNGPLAAFYGLENPQSDIHNPASPEWYRIDGLREQGRGGILGFAATLAKHSGASRTSAILRGTWVSEVVLGDKLPNPPRDVPILPEEAPEGLTERQLIERHSRDPNCAGCHSRFDSYGFALEGFDAIGRAREADTKTALRDGTPIAGLEDLRDYLGGERRQDFLGQFCRKLLGYALGRSVQLSDQPLLDELVAIEGNRIGDLVEHIVLSPQFRNGRGRELVTK